MKYKKEIIIIILALIALSLFFIFKNKKQLVDNGGVVVPVDTIYFDKVSKQWKDEYGVCNTCTIKNGFSQDGLILSELKERERLCYANKELSGLSGPGLREVYNYNFLEIVREDSLLKGNAESYPYGTDSSIAEFTGEYNSESFTAKLLMKLSSEGETWKEEQLIRSTEEGVQSIYAATSADKDGIYRIANDAKLENGFIFENVSCGDFDALQLESGYADVLGSLEISIMKKFTGKILKIENGKDGYTVLLENADGEKVYSTISIPNLGAESDFDFDEVKIGSVISVEGESFALGKDMYITAKHASSENINDYIGKTRGEAKNIASKNKVAFRVVSIDGKHLPVTKDYRPGRINASIVNDIVVSYFIEGKKQIKNEEKKTVSISNPASTFCVEKGGVLILKDAVGMCKLPNGTEIEEWEFFRKENKSYKGMTVKEAEALAKLNKVQFRVVEEDGELYGMTMDFRPGRINAVVEKGLVASYYVEGDFDKVELTNFDQCLDAGGRIMEIHPRQCAIANDVFVEEVSASSVFVPTVSRKTLNIGPKRVDCMGAFPQKCYISDGEYFYEGIHGFDFEEGYNYVIEVDVKPRCDTEKPETCPLDVGINSYHFVKTISKIKA